MNKFNGKKTGFKNMFILLSRSFSYMREKKKLYCLGLFLVSTEYFITFTTPYLYKIIVEVATNSEPANIPVHTIKLLFIILLISIPLSTAGRYLQTISTAKCIANISKALFYHIQKLPVFLIAERETGDYITRLTTDAYQCGNIFQSYLITAFIKFVVVFTSSLVILLVMNWRIAVLSIIFSLICFILSVFLNPKVRILEFDAKNAIARSLTHLIEVLQSLPVVKIFLLKEILLKRYNDICNIIYNKRVKYRVIRGFVFGIIDMFCFSAQPVALLIGIYFMSTHTATIGNMVFIATITGLMSLAILDFSSFIQQIQPALVASVRVFEIIDIPQEEYHKDTLPFNFNEENAISIKNLYFSYQTTPVIQNMNVEIRRGEKVSVIGKSGCGKSTLVKLLQLFYLPESGSITYFGTSFHSLSLESIRNLIAYIPQECILFEGTIAENIAFRADNINMDKIIEATKLAHIHNFITSLPNGYQTKVGEKGKSLSGGQCQRIAIARALFKDAPIIIMDEPTAFLDAKDTEAILYDIFTMLHEKTIIIVTHTANMIKTNRTIEM